MSAVVCERSSGAGMAIVKDAREMYDLDCVLCEENFKVPKVLPCLHTFCQACLEQIIRYVVLSVLLPGSLVRRA